jgi:hypothetical protein
MRLIFSVVALTAVLVQPALAQTASISAARASAPSIGDIEKNIGEAARSLEVLSRIMAVMGPGLSRAMQASGPGIGRAMEKAQPSLSRAMRTAEPQMAAMGSRMAASASRSAPNATPTGADMARGMQAAASSMEALSGIIGSVAPDLGRAYDAAAPELRGALAAARPALEEAMKAAEPELRRLVPEGTKPLVDDTTDDGAV